MATLEERVAYVEGAMNEQAQVFAAIRDSLARLDGRIDGLDDKMSRQFLWIVGIQITTLIGVVGAVLSRG